VLQIPVALRVTPTSWLTPGARAGDSEPRHATFDPDEGHLLLTNHWREILATLTAAAS